MAKQGPPVKAIKTTFDIIDILVELDGARFTKIVNQLGLPNSTVHDHLTTLSQLGYVVKNEDEYLVSTRFLEIGETTRLQMDLVQEAIPELEKLVKETGWHSSVMIEEYGLGVIVGTVKGDEATQLGSTHGRRMALHATAGGKAILAHLPDERLEDIINEQGLPDVTAHTITSKAELLEELEMVRERGYATNKGERRQGMFAYGAPILGTDGTVLGSITHYGPTHNVEEESFKNRIADAVLNSANVIQVTLNYPEGN